MLCCAALGWGARGGGRHWATSLNLPLEMITLPSEEVLSLGVSLAYYAENRLLAAQFSFDVYVLSLLGKSSWFI